MTKCKKDGYKTTCGIEKGVTEIARQLTPHAGVTVFTLKGEVIHFEKSC
jgi:hypothetical protein